MSGYTRLSQRQHYEKVKSPLIERKNKYPVLTKSNTKHANLVRQNILQGLTPYRNQIHTITYDNELEFSE